jgi:adenylate cyclase, class 2
MSASGLETEVKLAMPDVETALRKIREAGFTEVVPRVFEANLIYDTPVETLRQKGELLRLRQAGDRNVLTWKGVAVAGPHKSRPETEVDFVTFDAMDSILRRLGYQPVFRYEKYRTEFGHPPERGVLTLDETPIGCYLEIEGEAGWIDSTAQKLGFSADRYITASYASLYRTLCARTGAIPGWMVFQNTINTP